MDTWPHGSSLEDMEKTVAGIHALGRKALAQYGDVRILRPVLFMVYHLLEDISYQAGVLTGCLREKNWRPLSMELCRADAGLCADAAVPDHGAGNHKTRRRPAGIGNHLKKL